MAVPKWFLIAKNEYWIMTSGIRKIRLIFPFLIIGILIIIFGYGFPKFINVFVDELEAFFYSIAAVAIVQIILFMLFIYFLTFPITLALRDVQPEQNEIFLSAPISPSDVILGKFLGVIPFYAIGITIIAGLFIGVMDPLGIDLIQKIIIIIIFIIICLSGLWIGTVITALLRTKLGKTARGKDIGKALGLLIALPIIGVMYALMGGGLLESMANPNTSGAVRSILNLIPSSWGAEVIVTFAINPGNIGAIWLETLTYIGGLILFFIVILWLGTVPAGRIYSLEQTTFSSSTVKADGAFYRGIKYIGGGESFGAILVTMFKDYGRRLQNITWIVYIVGLFVLILIFISKPEGPIDILIFSNFIFPMLASVVVGDVTIRGKENLFIYRKTPNGEEKFVRARLIQSLLVVVPIVAIISTISLSLAPNIRVDSLLAYVGYSVLVISANTQFALGIFLMKPAFSETSGEFIANIMTVLMVNTIMFLFLIIIFELTWGMIIFLLTIWLIGFSLLNIGKRNLKRIE
jgi:hypothetical protein